MIIVGCATGAQLGENWATFLHCLKVYLVSLLLAFLFVLIWLICLLPNEINVPPIFAFRALFRFLSTTTAFYWLAWYRHIFDLLKIVLGRFKLSSFDSFRRTKALHLWLRQPFLSHEILVATSVVDNLAICEVGLCLILLLLEHLGAMAIGFNHSSTSCCHSRMLRLVGFGRLHTHWDITAFKLLGQLVLIEGWGRRDGVVVKGGESCLDISIDHDLGNGPHCQLQVWDTLSAELKIILLGQRLPCFDLCLRALSQKVQRAVDLAYIVPTFMTWWTILRIHLLVKCGSHHERLLGWHV